MKSPCAVKYKLTLLLKSFYVENIVRRHDDPDFPVSTFDFNRMLSCPGRNKGIVPRS
jgi:hypothetical protein